MLASTGLCRAQVVLDGSLGPAGPRLGPDYIIPESLGRRAGGNLFHSFSRLNVNTGESLTFTASGGTPTVNVVARVTGGERSSIDGLVRVSIPGANLFMVNRSGITFGPSSQLEVDGAVCVTTADVLRFSDGGTFSALPDAVADTVLSVAAPTAFGFLGTDGRPGSFEYTGDAAIQPLGLAPAAERPLAIVAGDVQITGGRVQSVGGRVDAVSVGPGAGEVALDVAAANGAVSVDGFDSLGAVDVRDGATLGAPDGGTLVVRGASLRVERAQLNADVEDTPGGGIDIDVTGRVDLVNARVSAEASGIAPGGALRIAADVIAASGLSAAGVTPISTGTSAPGRGGDISLTAREIAIAADAAFMSSSNGPIAGDGGNVNVVATERLVIDGAGSTALTGLSTQTFDDSPGNAGDIVVNAPVVRILERGEMTSTTRGSGDAGLIGVTAATELTIDGRNANTLTGLQSRVGRLAGQGATGAGGRIEVNTGTLRLIDGGVLSATTFGPGDGGSVTVNASDDVVLSAGRADIFNGIFSRTVLAEGGGRGGDVEVDAQRVLVTGPAEISAVSTGDGRAGVLRVAARDAVRVDDGAQLTVAAGIPDPRSLGPGEPPPSTEFTQASAGGLTVTAGPGGIEMTGGSVISARATLDSGRVKLDTPGRVHIVQSTITAQAGRSAGENGVIDIDPTAVILDRSTINGLAAGQDVPVRIVADVFLASQSAILSDTQVLPPEVDIAGSLVQLPGDAIGELARLADLCGANLSGRISSFVYTGRGGTPPQPGGFQPALPVVVEHVPNP